MKIIGSVKEDLAVEKRISITPETIKKFTDLKFSVFLEKNYAEHLGTADEEYIPYVPAIIAKGPYPIPFRTRKSSPSAPMVLCLKTWESRTLPA